MSNRAVNQLPLATDSDDSDVFHLVRVVGGNPVDRKIPASLVRAPVLTSGANISNAQILDLHNTPVVIAGPPPAGKILVPLVVMVTEVGATVSFAQPPLLVGSTTTVSDTVYHMIGSGPGTAPLDKCILYPRNGTSRSMVAEGDTISLMAEGANPTGGDGEYSVLTTYILVDA
jgi:hypothetical protein